MNKQELKNYGRICKEIKQIKDKIEETETSIKYPSVIISDMPQHHDNTKTDKIGIVIARVEELEELYTDKLNELLDQWLAIENAIKVLTPFERTIIRYRYLDLMRWEDICTETMYSWRAIHKIHSSILIKLEVEQ